MPNAPEDRDFTVSDLSLYAEIDDLRTRLTVARTDHANLVAAALATLHAYGDNEPDPLYYLRDELSAKGRAA